MPNALNAELLADRFRFGTGDHSATSPQTLFTAGGITVTTDGDADTDSTVRLVNATGSPWAASSGVGAIIGFADATTTTVTYSSSRAGTVVLRNEAEPPKALLIHCGNDISPNLMECWGFLSPEL